VLADRQSDDGIEGSAASPFIVLLPGTRCDRHRACDLTISFEAPDEEDWIVARVL
jgi:hypothetical protein